MHGSEQIQYCQKVFFQTEQNDVVFIKFLSSAFVWKCTDMHRFGVQLLQNPPLCSSTIFSPGSGSSALNVKLYSGSGYPDRLCFIELQI
jgi:hypothetical protein